MSISYKYILGHDKIQALNWPRDPNLCHLSVIKLSFFVI